MPSCCCLTAIGVIVDRPCCAFELLARPDYGDHVGHELGYAGRFRWTQDAHIQCKALQSCIEVQNAFLGFRLCCWPVGLAASARHSGSSSCSATNSPRTIRPASFSGTGGRLSPILVAASCGGCSGGCEPGACMPATSRDGSPCGAFPSRLRVASPSAGSATRMPSRSPPGGRPPSRPGGGGK